MKSGKVAGEGRGIRPEVTYIAKSRKRRKKKLQPLESSSSSSSFASASLLSFPITGLFPDKILFSASISFSSSVSPPMVSSAFALSPALDITLSRPSIRFCEGSLLASRSSTLISTTGSWSYVFFPFQNLVLQLLVVGIFVQTFSEQGIRNGQLLRFELFNFLFQFLHFGC